MRRCRPEVLGSLGLPKTPEEVEDTRDGGAAAFRAQFDYSELVAAGKSKAAKGWMVRLFRQTPYEQRLKWPASRRGQLVLLYQQGYSIFELSAVFDIWPSGIRLALKRNGIASPQRWQRWRDDEDRLLIDLVNQGSSCEEIAKLLHRTPLAVADRAAKLGMKEFGNQWRLSNYPRKR